jgi:hypothetical protein
LAAAGAAVAAGVLLAALTAVATIAADATVTNNAATPKWPAENENLDVKTKVPENELAACA